jgi:hypothetical protein
VVALVIGIIPLSEYIPSYWFLDKSLFGDRRGKGKGKGERVNLEIIWIESHG